MSSISLKTYLNKTENPAESIIKDFLETIEKIKNIFSKKEIVSSTKDNNTLNKKSISIETIISQKINNACAWLTKKIRQIRDYIVENPKKSALIGTAILVGGVTLYARYAKCTPPSTTIVRSNPPFHVDVPVEAKHKLETLMPLIAKGQDHPDIQWICKGSNYVFSLTSNPEIVFKLMPKSTAVIYKNSPENLLKQRFENMEKGRKICSENNLDLLKVPKASLLKTKEEYVLAEEKIPLNPNDLQQVKQYKNSPRLVRTAKQLAEFIARSEFNDVKPGNIPLIDGNLDETRKVALIDLEHMRNGHQGIFGQSFIQSFLKYNNKVPKPGENKSIEFANPGLINCFHRPEEKQAILEVASKFGIQQPAPPLPLQPLLKPPGAPALDLNEFLLKFAAALSPAPQPPLFFKAAAPPAA